MVIIHLIIFNVRVLRRRVVHVIKVIVHVHVIVVVVIKVVIHVVHVIVVVIHVVIVVVHVIHVVIHVVVNNINPQKFYCSSMFSVPMNFNSPDKLNTPSEKIFQKNQKK